MNEKKHSRCAFCKMQEAEQRRNEDYRWLDDENKDYYVILSDSPKITGHTLVVSRDHCDDITKLSSNKTSILQGIVSWSNLIKECLKAEKVYVMSICEHWQVDDIPSWKETTEHLHFHLLPRYKNVPKEERGEKFFTRPEDQGLSQALKEDVEYWGREILKTIRDRLLKCKRKESV